MYVERSATLQPVRARQTRQQALSGMVGDDPVCYADAMGDGRLGGFFDFVGGLVKKIPVVGDVVGAVDDVYGAVEGAVSNDGGDSDWTSGTINLSSASVTEWARRLADSVVQAAGGNLAEVAAPILADLGARLPPDLQRELEREMLRRRAQSFVQNAGGFVIPALLIGLVVLGGRKRRR